MKDKSHNALSVAIMTGGQMCPYSTGLAAELDRRGVRVELVGNEATCSASNLRDTGVQRRRLYGEARGAAGRAGKLLCLALNYARLLRFAARTKADIFHIQWLNRFESFDRLVLIPFFKLLGKRVVFTAHNVNTAARDEHDSAFNRRTLGVMYRGMNRVFVHTEKMKQELVEQFGVAGDRITLIPLGIYSMVPESALTAPEARAKLQLRPGEKVILFFGNIAPYKGIDSLVAALGILKDRGASYTLLVAGGLKSSEAESYWQGIRRDIESLGLTGQVRYRIEEIPDAEVECYFKAADVAVLPYRSIFQSAVLVLAFRFGLPVIATDVGSLREDVIDGKTGFIARPADPEDLAAKIELFFRSELYVRAAEHRAAIRGYAEDRFSWQKVGEKTCEAYLTVLGHAVGP